MSLGPNERVGSFLLQISGTICAIGILLLTGCGRSRKTFLANVSSPAGAVGDSQLADYGDIRVLTPGTSYGPAESDGFVAVYARLDGRTGAARVQLNLGSSSDAMADWAHAMLYNNGVTYLGTAQLLVPVIRGQYFQILCDGGGTCSNGGWLGNAVMYFQPVASRSSQSVFGAPAAMGIGEVYGPAETDGFVSVYGRREGAIGLGSVRVVTGTTARPQRLVAYGYSHNDGSNYLASYQVMAPVRKGEYYQVLCDGATACQGGSSIGDAKVYFQPVGNAAVTALGAPVDSSLGASLTPAQDSLLFLYGQSDGVGNHYDFASVAWGTTVLGWGGSYNFNPGGVPASYFGNFQLKVPLHRGRTYQPLCDAGAGCADGAWIGSQLLYVMPTAL